jgi:hypothetical protein
MQLRSALSFVLALYCLGAAAQRSAPANATGNCLRGVMDGELTAGQPWSQPISADLKVYFQPIRSGWILRVLPASGPLPEHDYAELATPPYQSVTPLSISTDFAFRAQDAIGWNPRRFRFATSTAAYSQLYRLYGSYEQAAAMSPGAAASERMARLLQPLSEEIAKAAEGTLTLLDSRLVPGTADQWRAAAAVASHFNSTAHTLVQEPDGSTSPLGRLVWLRFRLELDLPAGFAVNRALHVQPRNCAAH